MNQRILLTIIAVAGALLFSSYGNAESHVQKKSNTSIIEQSPQKQASNKTREIISFKGIPLGKPGVRDALQKMCMGKKFNSKNDRCSFTDERSMVLLDYETLVDTFALVILNSDKALVKVEIDGTTQEMLTLGKTLETKYGKPLKKNTIIKNAIGTQLDQEIFIWMDDQGSRITVNSIYYDYNKGGVVIESSSSVGVQKDLSGAANLYQTVVENYGDSEYAYEAQSRLGSIQNQ